MKIHSRINIELSIFLLMCQNVPMYKINSQNIKDKPGFTYKYCYVCGCWLRTFLVGFYGRILVYIFLGIETVKLVIRESVN